MKASLTASRTLKKWFVARSARVNPVRAGVAMIAELVSHPAGAPGTAGVAGSPSDSGAVLTLKPTGPKASACRRPIR